MQAAGRPSVIPRWAAAASAVPQTEFGDTLPHTQTTGTVSYHLLSLCLYLYLIQTFLIEPNDCFA